MTLSEKLREYNRWRRGDDEVLQTPHPKDIGEMIDEAADRLEVLERERDEFYYKQMAAYGKKSE